MIFKGTKQDVPALDPILGPTYGIIIYQEQVMQIVRDLAGYTMGRSDLVRRAMSKKKEHVILEERQTFVYGNQEQGVPGCIANGISEHTANVIYDAMVDFAKYAFNKSHAACYSVVSFYTAYLKHFYAADYLASVANYAEDTEAINSILEDARENGVETLPPDINSSDEKFSVREHNGRLAIMFGLGGVKDVASNAAGIIEKRGEKPFEDFREFLLRCNVKRDSLCSLIDAGAFDAMGYSRKVLRDEELLGGILDLIKKIKDKAKFAAAALKASEYADEFSDVGDFTAFLKENHIPFAVTSKKMPTKDAILKRRASALEKVKELTRELYSTTIPKGGELSNEELAECLEREKRAMGLYLTGHPVDAYDIITPAISDIEPGKNVTLCGCVSGFAEKISRSGSKFARFMVEDRTGSIRCNIFASNYSNMGDTSMLRDGSVVRLEGEVKVDTFFSTEDETVYCMNVSTVSRCRHKGASAGYQIEMPIDEYWSGGYSEKLAEYADPYGEKLTILDTVEGLSFTFNMRVGESILDAGVGAVIKTA